MSAALVVGGGLLSAAVMLLVLGLVGLAVVLWDARALIEGRR